MMNPLRFLVFLVPVLGMAAVVSAEPLESIPLRYETDAEPSPDELHRSAWNPALTRRSCRLMPVVDERKEIGSEEIGYSEVEQQKVARRSDVPRFVGEGLVRVFGRFGLKHAGPADVGLHVGLREFRVLEGSTYFGRATLRFAAIDAKGDALVDCVATGACERWGGSCEKDSFRDPSPRP